MSMDRHCLEFVLYCVENLADDLGKDTIDVYDLFKNSGVLYDYIVPLYGALHTQGRDYIVEDLRSVLQKKGIAL